MTKLIDTKLTTIVSVTIVLLVSACSNSAVRTSSDVLESGAEIHNMEAIIKTVDSLAARYGSQSVLITFDIDNTLLASTTALGSDQWFEWQSDNPPKGVPANFGCLLEVQGLLYHLGRMRPTQPNVADLIRQLQNRGFPVLALTSRGTEFRLVTHREFRRNGLDFSQTTLGQPGHDSGVYLPYDPDNVIGFSSTEISQYKLVRSSSRPRPVRFEDGVYLTAGQHKGAMLRLLLQKLEAESQVKAVVFVDDKAEHVEGMIEALDVVGKPVYAYRYAREDKNVSSFFNNTNSIRTQTHKEWCGVAEQLDVLNGVFESNGDYHLSKSCNDLSKLICAR